MTPLPAPCAACPRATQTLIRGRALRTIDALHIGWLQLIDELSEGEHFSLDDLDVTYYTKSPVCATSTLLLKWVRTLARLTSFHETLKQTRPLLLSAR